MKKGFTLIELLIVIVIIGLLAAVVIAAINPVEARRRAVDTGLKSDAAQLYNAIERHYATRGTLPWGATSIGNVGVVASTAGWVGGALVTTQEIKPEFVARPNLANIRVYQNAGSGGADSVSVCFTPESQAFLDLRNGNATGVRVPVGTGTQVCVPE